MKHLKLFENKSLMDFVKKIKNNDYEYVEAMLKNGDMDVNATVGSAIRVPLITSVNDIGMLELLTEYGANWFMNDHRGKNFIDRLEEGKTENQIKILKYIKWKYPEKYQEYLTRKESDKYNL